MIGDVVSAAFLLGGALLCLLAGIGLHRFDDVFARMHVATKPPTLGLLLVAIGVSVELASAGAVAKMLLVALLALLTAPTAAHMIGRAAYRSGNELSERTVLDELSPYLDSEGGDPPS